MSHAFEMLGFAGALIVAIGYLPQIVHLAREHCSAGVSINAWFCWLLSSLLIFLHAFDMADPVFITLQTVNIVAILSIIILAKRYQKSFCESHRPHHLHTGGT